MALQRILLTDSPGQKFSTVVGGVRCNFEFRYNTVSERFYFSIQINDAWVLQGRTLTANVDLLSSYPDIAAIMGNLFCVDIDAQGRDATLENIVSGDVRIFLNTP